MVKNLPANAGDTRDVDLIPGSGRSPREGNVKPLQYSCLENSDMTEHTDTWTLYSWQVLRLSNCGLQAFELWHDGSRVRVQ